MLRVGQGIDYHQIGEGREFWLGGVKLDYPLGCIGHSDADVLLHAICDAMLGALALGDIDSKILLQKTADLIASKNYTVINVDSTICLEAPKIMKYVPQMQQVIATILCIGIDAVSIKATTTETMGFIGRKEGVMAQAVVLLQAK
jgi:2-C-methyl-D-erythritol 2,4-cyclodiphosphate synthase